MRVRAEGLVRELCAPAPRRVLDGLDLELEGAGVHALIGHNGSGKTTLLRVLALLDRPQAGVLRFDDQVVAGPQVRAPSRAARRRVTLVFDRPALLRGTVRWNLGFALRAHGVPVAEHPARLADAAAAAGLETLLDQRVDRLSAGEARRAALARAVALRTELLLLDEPTANLDPLSAGVIERLLRELGERGETRVLLATHDLGQARRLAQHVHFLGGGVIAQGGEAAGVLDAPRSHALAEFLGVENLFRGEVKELGDRQRFESPGFSCTVIADRPGPCWAGIPARDILVSEGPVASSALNAVAGTLATVEERGPIVLVSLDPAEGTRLTAAVTRATRSAMKLEPGRRVHFTFKAASVRLFEG